MENYNIKINDNLTLIGYKYLASGEVKGQIVICHGMAEHIERYDHFANFLASNGYLVYGYNQRGHGLTAGSVEKLGYMDKKDNFKAMISDLHHVISLVKEENPTLKTYLFGHSMGSFISKRYIQLYPNDLTGVVLCGSSLNKGALFKVAYCLASILTTFQGRKHKSKLLNSLSFGSYNNCFKPNRTEFDWLSSNEENVDKYIADEYCGTVFSTSFFKDMTHMFNQTGRCYGKENKDLPILMIGGEMDPVSENSKGLVKLEEVYKKKGIKDVNLIIYPGMRHEILNETDNSKVYNDVLSWLLCH